MKWMTDIYIFAFLSFSILWTSSSQSNLYLRFRARLKPWVEAIGLHHKWHMFALSEFKRFTTYEILVCFEDGTSERFFPWGEPPPFQITNWLSFIEQNRHFVPQSLRYFYRLAEEKWPNKVQQIKMIRSSVLRPSFSASKGDRLFRYSSVRAAKDVAVIGTFDGSKIWLNEKTKKIYDASQLSRFN